jgi:hypothetical protein
MLKYDSADTLASVLQRLELLNSAEIFRANPPPFGNANARVHQIKSLTLILLPLKITSLNPKT